MGHSSKKKKKHGGGGRLKGRAQSKDHGSHARDDNEHISEEITALWVVLSQLVLFTLVLNVLFETLLLRARIIFDQIINPEGFA